MRPGFPASPIDICTLDAYPDLLDLRHAFPERYPCLLETVGQGAHGRPAFDILFAFPGDTLVLEDWYTLVRYVHGQRMVLDSADFLAGLDDWYQCQAEAPAAVPHYATDGPQGLPFLGGWFIYLGYELAAQIEPHLQSCMSYALPRPMAMAQRFPAAVIRDRLKRCCYIITEPGLHDQVAIIRQDLDRLQPNELAGKVSEQDACDFLEDDDRTYLAAIERIHHYIRAGDVFQVNLSRQWSAARISVCHDVLYARLRERNPAPFAGIADLGGRTLISSSPERLVCVRGDRIETRPIAGTRPRGNSQHEDARLADILLANPKEQAEHIMLIDLERNDLGRVCQTGSISVDELMVLESYRHVHHIVSNVSGRKRAGVLPGEIIRAVFPGGTITGCPKLRCMEIIAELEATARSAYTGSMGYLNRDGSMDLNILIRSLECCQDQIVLRAGAGIVADSIAERELAETRVKAKGLLAVMSHPS